MIDRITRGERADKQFIRDAVRPLFEPPATDLSVEQSVPVGVQRTYPQPTGGAVPERPMPIDLRIKSVSFVAGLRSLHRAKYTTNYTEYIGARLLEATR